MANVYTELAKKRMAQNTTPVNQAAVAPPEPTPQPPATPATDEQPDMTSRPTPLPSSKKISKAPVKQEKKRKIGAYFTKSQRQVLDDLEYKLNRGERVIIQSDILALGVETLAKLLDGKQTKFTSVEKIRAYIDALLLKHKAP
jgi:hypothetical protein